MNVLLKRINLSLVLFILSFTVSCGGSERPPRLPSKPLPRPVPKPEPVPDPMPGKKSCVIPGSRFNVDGRYKTRTFMTGKYKLVKPITDGNCISPIFNFSNGTNASLLYYRSIVQRMASHGYVVSSVDTRQSGSGRENYDAVLQAREIDNVDRNKVCLNGHSQGGQGVASVTYKLEQKFPEMKIASMYSEPAFGMNNPSYTWQIPLIKSDAFVFSGSRDTVVPKSWVMRGWSRMQMKNKYWYEGIGASHLNATSWMATGGLVFCNMSLLGHEDAKSYFGNLPDSRFWRFVDE